MKVKLNALIVFLAIIVILFLVPPLISAPNTVQNIGGVIILFSAFAVMYGRILRLIKLLEKPKDV